MISNNQIKGWQSWLFLPLTILLLFLSSCWQEPQVAKPNKLGIKPTFEEKIDYSNQESFVRIK